MTKFSLIKFPLSQKSAYLFTFICFTVTVLLTWELWLDRSYPVNLPVFGGIGISFAFPMVVSIAAAIFDRRFLFVSLAVFLLSVMADQTRLQPEFISMFILSFSLSFEKFRPVGVVHLLTLWFWAGAHKLLSSSFPYTYIENQISVGWPLTQIVLGTIMLVLPISLIITKHRKQLILFAAVMHISIFGWLVLGGWNSAVWMWNLSIAAGVYPLFISTNPKDYWGKAMKYLTIFMFAYPALFYLDKMDAYLAHNLYSGSTRVALVCEGDELDQTTCTNVFDDSLIYSNVPLPPESRLYEQWFEKICTPGQTLVIRSNQLWFTDSKIEDFRCSEA